MGKKVGIIGYGWVGKAMKQVFPDALIYSPNLDLTGTEINKWEDHKEELQKEINKCDVVFICVPTPCPNKTRLDVQVVEDSIAWCEASLLVVRSTLNPGDCDFFKLKYQKRIVMQPEYLGETPQHPLLDTLKTPFMIIGGDRKDREELIELYTTVFNANVRIEQVTTYAAEIIKLTENRAVAWKVAQIQELYDVCKTANIDFYTVRDLVYGIDPRFNLWWTFVYPEKRGFNSKCIPKDVYAWMAWAESTGYDPKITRALVEKNAEWIGEVAPKETPKEETSSKNG